MSLNVFTIEEQQIDGRRRWIVRNASGQILFLSEQPLNW
jgi:hypothetical protein